LTSTCTPPRSSMRVATLRPTICAAPAETDCQRRAQVENLVGAGGVRYDLGFQLYWRSLGKRASFALKFGFIAEMREVCRGVWGGGRGEGISTGPQCECRLSCVY